jgi:micrococcal nuclease
VKRVIDGDTFDSGSTRIRLFGVDTPERGDKCFNEATNRFTELAGDSVRVESGPRQGDRYGRILYYVYTEGGESIDETLVREGLALAWGWDGQYRDLCHLSGDNVLGVFTHDVPVIFIQTVPPLFTQTVPA